MTNLRSFHAVGTACCNLLLEKDEHPKCKTDNLWDSARLLWCAGPGHHLVVQPARRLITKIQLDLVAISNQFLDFIHSHSTELLNKPNQ